MDDFNHKHYNYTWTKGFILAICITLLLLSGAVFGQTVTSGSVNTPSGYSIDLTTGNMIPYDSSIKSSTGWSVSGLQGSFVNDGYTFSYANSTISTSANLANLVHGYQNTGAIFVTGFNYGFKYRFQCANSIGGSCENVNGLQDNLSATAQYLSPNGTVEWSQLHQLGLKNINDGNPPYNPNWQQLNNSHTFAGAKSLATLGTFSLSISGSDAGFWACLMPDCYGPQVKDAFLNVNYSVDPCILNPAYAPSCPGFNAVLQGPLSPLIWNNYNIATALPHIGGGVQLHGFDYGFGYYAGDYCTNTFLWWCTSSSGANGRNVTLNITDKLGNSLFSQNWWVEGNYSGGARSGSMLFTETKNTLNMGYVSWSVYGGYGDNMGFAGYTRPIWTPDPCYDQPLYSKNCSNFDAEIKRLADEQNKIQKASLEQTIANISTTSSTPGGTVTNTITDANTASPSVSTTTVTATDTTAATTSPKSTSTTTTADTVAQRDSGSQPNQTATRTESARENNTTSFALSLINRNQERETNIATQASQNAMQTAAVAAGAGTRQAEAIALEAVNRSQNMQQQQEQHSGTENVVVGSRTDSILNIGPAPGSTSVVNLAIQQRTTQGQTAVDITPQTTNTVTSTSAIVQFNAMSVVTVQPVQQFNPLQPPVFSQTAPVVVVPYQAPVQQNITETKPTEVANFEQPVNTSSVQINILQPPQQTNITEPSQSFQSVMIAPVVAVDIPQAQSNFTTDRTNPINDIIENKQSTIEQERKDTNTQQVKSNVQDNDAAAGVSIDTIARTPTGFSNYMIALSDANFYAPKEIYRNQRNVDNARALRQLASDRLHQEMVDQQYRR